MRKNRVNKRIPPTILLFLIFFFSFFIRFYKLGKIPQVLTRDEAAIGYNAYSILKTGKDEYGVKFPLYFLSFGDYKNPLYIYLTTFLIPFFGLTEFTVRFLSALSGSLTILVVYFLVKEFFSETENNIEFMALMSAFLLAISPFHIFYSRMAYEATLCLFFTLFGVLFLLKARKKGLFFILSLILFILSFFTYNPPIFILPILVPIIIFFFKKENLIKNLNIWTISFLILFYFSLGGYFFLSKNLIKGRSEATIFAKNFYQNQMTLWEIDKKPPPFGLKFFLRKKPFIFYKLISNYFSVFKKEFLFEKGDGHLWHGVGLTEKKAGNLYFLILPFFILGIVYILKERKKEWILILFWFLISPLACTFTQDSPNTTRLFEYLFLFGLISTFGINYFLNLFKRLSSIIFLFLLFLSLGNLNDYLKVYFNYYPKALCQAKFSSMWPCGIKEVIGYANKNKQKYSQIFIVTSEDNEEPYIQFAFYLKIDPFYFQEKVLRKKTQFFTVKNLSKYYFEELPINVKIIDKDEIVRIKKRFSKPNSLFITRNTNNLLENISLTEIKKINDPENKPLWLFLKNK